jgi:predicted O-methyltransferase YrrM
LSNAETVLRTIERMMRRRFLPIVGPKRGKILIDIIREIRPRRILEVGTLVGYSAVLMGKELENDAHLTTIEIDADEAKVARENIEKAQISLKVDVIEGDAKKVLPTLSGRLDMVFIDAEKTEYLQYLCLIERRLHKGSVVVADNAGIFADEMRDYLNYVRSSDKYGSKYVPFGEDGVEVSTKL